MTGHALLETQPEFSLGLLPSAINRNGWLAGWLHYLWIARIERSELDFLLA